MPPFSRKSAVLEASQRHSESGFNAKKFFAEKLHQLRCKIALLKMPI
jgi:hypothetical protein